MKIQNAPNVATRNQTLHTRNLRHIIAQVCPVHVDVLGIVPLIANSGVWTETGHHRQTKQTTPSFGPILEKPQSRLDARGLIAVRARIDVDVGMVFVPQFYGQNGMPRNVVENAASFTLESSHPVNDR
tara:strand:- start:18244 stop:18627 length:384 start_codon:yes stop_codon:yes gene_type:complete